MIRNTTLETTVRIALLIGLVSASLSLSSLCAEEGSKKKRPWFSLKTEETEAARKAEAGVAFEEGPKISLEDIEIPESDQVIPDGLSLPNPPPGDNPLAIFWNDKEFVKRFAGSYGFLSGKEPKITATNEIAAYKAVREILATNATDGASVAISLLSTNITPDSSAVLDYTMATLHYQKGDNNKAVESYRTALEKWPSYLRARKNLALALVKDGNYAEATPELAKTIEEGGGDAVIYSLLGYSLMSAEKFMAAEAAYQNALMFDPAKEQFKRAILNCQVSQGKLVSASALADELLREHPLDDKLWELKARIQLQQQKMMEAALTYEILRKLDKASLANIMLLGDLYLSDGNLDMALDAYLEGIEKDGENDIKRSLRAINLLTGQGAWGQAKAMFTKVREIHKGKMSDEEELQLLKLESKAAIASDEGDKAVKVLEQIVSKNPLDGEALLMLGDYYKTAAEVEKAEERYNRAAKLDDFRATANLKIGQLLVMQRKYQVALEFLDKSLKEKPSDSIQRYRDAVERALRGSR